MKKYAFIFFLLFSNCLYAVPEIPDPTVKDIAVTTVRNGEVVILYNPAFCKQLGPLVCRSFRAHEYGHVHLGHTLKHTHPVKAEFEADCWAAKNAPLEEVQAAYRFFKGQGERGNWTHGSGAERAQRILRCASARVGWDRTR